jgi:exopolyphosphatase/pppGpp-phosphohydrolase
MKYIQIKFKYNLCAIFFLVSFFSFSQENIKQYAGIEIGAKGIKMLVTKLNEVGTENQNIAFWTENTTLVNNISKSGDLAIEDIDKTIEVVVTNFDTIKSKYGVEAQDIFIMASSSISNSGNVELLVNKIETATNKKLFLITPSEEGEMVLKSSIDATNYFDAFVLDIGGGNTKGGFVESKNNEAAFVYFPVNLPYGTVTLTAEIEKKSKKNDIDDFQKNSFGCSLMLRNKVSEMYNINPEIFERKKVYMSGGAVWSFYTLYKGNSTSAYNKFELKDVLTFDAMIKNNFQKYEEQAKTDPKVEKVLQVFSQKNLIAACSLLKVCLEAIPELNDKALYFSSDTQQALLLSFIKKNIKQ